MLCVEGGLQHPKTNMTVAEYVAQSADWDEKFEYINGEIYGMSGGSSAHAAIGFDVGVALATRLRGSGCRGTSSDQRIFVEGTNAFFYPDVTVVCGKYQYAADGLSVLNPVLLVEVLSPSTALYDRGAKLEHYTCIPSLNDVLIIDPETRSVTHHTRTEQGWLRRNIADGAVDLPRLDLALPLDEMFGDLENVIAD